MTVELTDQECRIFKLLAKSGALDLRNGSVEIHFDSFGSPVKAKTTTFTSMEDNQEKLSTRTNEVVVVL